MVRNSVAWRWLLCLIVAWPWCAHAASELTVRAPFVAETNGVYLLSTQLQFDLPNAVEQAIQDGAVLDLTLQVKVSRSRTWWRDAVLAELEQRYELVYHRVSERYLVRNLNSGALSSFPELATALASLESIQGLPVLDKNLIESNDRNEISVRAQVKLQSLPSVLSVLLFWKSEFDLQSDWYSWSLTP